MTNSQEVISGMHFRVLIFIAVLGCISRSLRAQQTEPVQITVTDGVIHGTLTLPKGSARPPLALIISDAGGVDRNGDAGIAAHHCLRLLSDSLVRRGIATLRYDKRGIGESQAVTDETRIRFSDYVMDLIAWTNWARARAQFSRIVLVGHGEGALVAALAGNDAGADAVAAICAPGEPADSLILRQVTAQGLRAGPLDTVRMMFRELRQTGKVEGVPNGGLYFDMFRPSVQQYLFSWMQYDPAEAVRSLRKPLLIVSGAHDLRNDPIQFHKLKAAAPKAKAVLIPGMNNVFREAPLDPQQNFDTFYYGNVPINGQLVRTLAAFISRK